MNQSNVSRERGYGGGASSARDNREERRSPSMQELIGKDSLTNHFLRTKIVAGEKRDGRRRRWNQRSEYLNIDAALVAVVVHDDLRYARAQDLHAPPHRDRIIERWFDWQFLAKATLKRRRVDGVRVGSVLTAHTIKPLLKATNVYREGAREF